MTRQPLQKKLNYVDFYNSKQPNKLMTQVQA